MSDNENPKLKKNFRELTDAKDLLTAVFEQSPEAMFITDPAGCLIAVNDRGNELLGYPGDEIIGKNIADLAHPDDPAREAIPMDALARGHIIKKERRLFRKDGSLVSVENRFRRLAGGVAHDFNNMLSAILGQAELSMMEHHLPDQIHGSFKLIKEAALRSAELVRQLLTFARKQAVAPHVLNLNKSVAGMHKMLHRLIGENIELVWLPGADLWPVKIDPSQIDQLLVNLCVNARDAITGVGKITIETRNSVFDVSRCAAHPNFKCGEFVMLSVSDTGSGMSQVVLDNLFEPFFTTKWYTFYKKVICL